MPTHFSVKESVFPFNKFPGVDIILGPGDAVDRRGDGDRRQLPDGVRQGQMAASAPLPATGTVFISVADRDKEAVVPIARSFAEMGYRLIATRGTATRPARARHRRSRRCRRLQEGRPNLIDHMKNGEVALVINTPSGRGSRPTRGRSAARRSTHRVTCITTLAAAQAAVEACRALKERELTVVALQDRFPT